MGTQAVTCDVTPSIATIVAFTIFANLRFVLIVYFSFKSFWGDDVNEVAKYNSEHHFRMTPTNIKFFLSVTSSHHSIKNEK